MPKIKKPYLFLVLLRVAGLKLGNLVVPKRARKGAVIRED
jgi:hypothetical protein